MSARSRSRVVFPWVLACGTAVLAGCAGSEADGGAGGVTAFEGATLLVGDGTPPIEDGVLLVTDGRITAVGTAATLEVPRGAARVDLTGKTVMPAIVNAHVHLASEREERIAQLEHMAYYGAGAVVSLGQDTGSVALAMRSEDLPGLPRTASAGRGITSPEPGRTTAPHWVTTADEGRAAVRELAAQRVDIVKIWVDDRNGEYEKLPPEIYQAVIDEAHRHGLRVTAHIFALEDAKALLRAGIDAFAHGIRDRDIDDELVALWKERPAVVLVPNLPDPGVPQDYAWLAGTVPPEQLARMQEGATDRPDLQEAFGIQARNLARLAGEGIRVAFGTDGSVAWAPHLEMEDMVRSGMSPAAVIVAATGSSADFMRMGDVGTLVVGKSADFIVLDANPLDDIRNTRRIASVYLRGEEVDRAAIGARLASPRAP
ncbi:MAG: amidohydrolase family protein [Gemmatimonadales bacterium]